MEFFPQKFRETVFQILFSFDMGGEFEEEYIPSIVQELRVSKKSVREAYQQAKDVWEKRKEIDEIISCYSRDYSLDRIKAVERNVLRLAFYELLVEKELNTKIVISEAHRLARKFSAIEGAAFVNAVLDSFPDGSSLSLSIPKAPL